MIIKHFATTPAQNLNLLLSLVSSNYLYQKSITYREVVGYKLTALLGPIYHRLFKSSQSKWSVSMAQLSEYPEGTLGQSWYQFYMQNNFSIYPNYEEHDIAHVLLGFKTTTIEEARMIYFMFGAGKYSYPTLVTMIFGFIIFPEFISTFYQDYKQGTQVVNFTKWDFRHLLNEPIQTLRDMILKKHDTQESIIIL